ncbi:MULTISPECIES: class I SAM-dependent methyltransferase [Cyanophyceae]|uniref:class I SAM-dependent methyltransferase n=1 Tax=Cyanophyceae TaxID=3028117 RepID=UPI001683B4C2|nr:MULTISPECIES: class I SAM-dependent methyltransferase [Cyanophyceae]MBD1916381.1 class I SAM-dependent methyltransferase [Phormidium sp. FACHB-77]MBD2032673.1 class I SAM-dependent methyltransferase [Phormidium sp. FACHB-322]MBD2050045.1 class I SAM-dependent methyltransferase [Leptolyngbya sp. FACHB-60]
MPHNPDLYQALCDRIRQSPHQRISFAEFMELALYHPQGGYYTSKETILGFEGDFVTSAHLGHDFGELLAIQFAEMWENLGCPNPFSLVEMGAGQGLIAADALGALQNHFPDCFAALSYQIVEKSDRLRAAQEQRLSPWAGRVTWLNLEDIPDNSITGCFFTNELVDALPVHQVVMTESGLQEVYITLADGPDAPVVEVLDAPSTPRLADYFAFVGIDLADPQYTPGYRTEVHLAALDWMKTVATKLQQGYVLTVDYGYPASRYYSRARALGTLQCYYQHAHHDNPYSHLGHQDITAHVNFTALERQGEHCGLETLEATQQGMFLMALGLGDRLAALGQIQASDPTTVNLAIQRREKLHQLINPMGLGNFVVLVQGKGLLPAAKTLKGLTVPPLM